MSALQCPQAGMAELADALALGASARKGVQVQILFPAPSGRYTVRMAFPSQPNIKLVNTPEYREHYANSVQVRVNVWDFFLVFGTLQQAAENEVEVHNFQGVYLSPQQAKALTSILRQNIEQYEKTFGEIKLDPSMAATGIVN